MWDGFLLGFLVTSLDEPLMRPTTMTFHNLVGMDIEQSIRANRIDCVVLLVGRDKTMPALTMGTATTEEVLGRCLCQNAAIPAAASPGQARTR